MADFKNVYLFHHKMKLENNTGDLETLRDRAQNWKKKNNRSLGKVHKHRNLDSLCHEAHAEAFSKIDCLACANCCRTTGPLFTGRDIERLAKHLGISARHFIETFLRTDEDGDIVLKSVPCPFLLENNECRVYDFRPKACREYPHTDSKNQSHIFHLTLKNAEICPAVLEILQKISGQIEAGRLHHGRK